MAIDDGYRFGIDWSFLLSYYGLLSYKAVATDSCLPVALFCPYYITGIFLPMIV